MKARARQFLLLLLLAALFGAAHFSGLDNYVTFENLKEHQGLLQQTVAGHYLSSVALYILVYIFVALTIPGALLLAVAGGLLFHTLPGAVYATVGATAGAVIAFVLSRYIVGEWLQTRFMRQLRQFNGEVRENGYFYLMALRLVPVFPFFVANYLCGLTKVPLKTFVWATAAGLFPACLVYSFAGSRMGSVSSLSELLSPRLLAAFVLIALVTLLPVLWKRLRPCKSAIPGAHS